MWQASFVHVHVDSASKRIVLVTEDGVLVGRHILPKSVLNRRCKNSSRIAEIICVTEESNGGIVVFDVSQRVAITDGSPVRTRSLEEDSFTTCLENLLLEEISSS